MIEETITPHLNDHDLLIRIDERTRVIQQQIVNFDTTQNAMEKRVEDLEKWQSEMTGQQKAMVKSAAIWSSVMSSLAVGTIMFVLTRYVFNP